MNSKAIISLVIILFLGTSFLSNVIIAEKITFEDDFNNIQKESLSQCYGFIILLPRGLDTTDETFLNSKVRHLINDLLRENIRVYWAGEDFSALTKKIGHENSINENNFEKGDFIVPFSGDYYLDVLTTVIVYDYNHSSEIEDDNSFHVEVYKLMSPLNVNAYEVVEVKIAQHFGTATRYGWPAYLQIAEAGGFLTIDFLMDGEPSKYLNNNDFNVFMWPYNPTRSNVLELAQSVYNRGDCNAIRRFVQNGGGFIGSCYGADMGSSGWIKLLPITSLRRYYIPSLPCRGLSFFLSLSDSLKSVQLFPKIPFYVATLEIKDTDHPLSFGLNKTIKDFMNGAWFVWLGKNSANVATIKKLEVKNDNFNSIFYRRKIIGTSDWVYSRFEDGKVVLFAGHPEFVNNLPVLSDSYDLIEEEYYGRRVMHNALFYATSKDIAQIDTQIGYNVSLIESIWEQTADIDLNSSNESAFENIKIGLVELNENLSHLVDMSTRLKSIYSDQVEDTLFFETKHIYLFEYAAHYSNIFQELNQKAIRYLDNLSKTYVMLGDIDELIFQDVELLKNSIIMRLNNSKIIFSKVISITNYLEKNLMKENRNVVNNLKIVSNSRLMLRSYTTLLKYIPQINFETLKLLRNSWYNYEAYSTLEFI